MRKLTYENFQKRSHIIHSNKYIYPNNDYINNETKIDIICPIDGHGVFQQTPGAHLRGQGCPKCGTQRSNDAKRLKQKEFEKRLLSLLKKHTLKNS